MNPPRFYQYVEFFVAKLLHFILLLFIPMMIMPPTSLVSSCVYNMLYDYPPSSIRRFTIWHMK